MKAGWWVAVMAALVVAVPAGAVDVAVEPTGRIYANWHYNASGYPDWDPRVLQDDRSTFEMQRGYLGLKAKFGADWSAVLVADVGQETKTQQAVEKQPAKRSRDGSPFPSGFEPLGNVRKSKTALFDFRVEKGQDGLFQQPARLSRSRTPTATSSM